MLSIHVYIYISLSLSLSLIVILHLPLAGGSTHGLGLRVLGFSHMNCSLNSSKAGYMRATQGNTRTLDPKPGTLT